VKEKKKELIIDFILNRISKKEFLDKYSVDASDIQEHVLFLINSAYDRKNNEELEQAFLLGFSFGFTKDYVQILCLLLLEDWHCQHENIAMIFQLLKDPKSINCLYEGIQLKFDYLAYNDSKTFIEKCAWALGDIKTPESKEKLMLLLDLNDPIITEAVNFQLSRD
jgi:hypothetical protein